MPKASPQAVLKAVLKFATRSGLFVTPKEKEGDPEIEPAFDRVSETKYVHVWHDFHLALRQDGVMTEVPLDRMRRATTWSELARLAHENQR